MASFVFFEKQCKIKVYYILHLIKWEMFNFIVVNQANNWQIRILIKQKQITGYNLDFLRARVRFLKPYILWLFISSNKFTWFLKESIDPFKFVSNKDGRTPTKRLFSSNTSKQVRPSSGSYCIG